MKYFIFGCLLILLGIAAMRHESPTTDELPMPSKSGIIGSISDADRVHSPSFKSTDNQSLVRFTAYPSSEQDSQLQVIRMVNEGG